MSSVHSGITHVVIADDDALIRLVVRTALEGEGWSVVEADSSAQVLDILESVPVAVAILDANMPGPGLTTVLAEVARVARPPGVIILSGAPVDESLVASYRTESADGGTAMYLAKPVDLSTLVGAVNGLASVDEEEAPSLARPDGETDGRR